MCRFPGKYKIVLDSDWAEFGGHERNDRYIWGLQLLVYEAFSY